MSAERPRWDPGGFDRNCCRNCGTKVTPQFTRVFGDDNNIIHRCPECASYRELGTGARDTEALV